MRDISLHLSDIIENSCTADATEVTVSICYDSLSGMLETEVADNGCGMDEQTVLKVQDPFFTARRTRSVGLGLPFLKMNAEMTGGTFSVKSVPNEGTSVMAEFNMKSVDSLPLGNIAEAILIAAVSHTDTRFVLRFNVDENSFLFDTNEAKEILGGSIGLNDVNVYQFLKEFLCTNISEIAGGKI